MSRGGLPISLPRGLPIGLVAAIGRDGVIGAAGALPWRLRSDLRHFRALTLGKPVIMGRKTFESIGRLLPGRRTIIVTHNRGLAIAGADVVGSLSAAIELAQEVGLAMGAAEIAVAGGGDIFRGSIDVASALHLTEVQSATPGDVFFPKIDPAVWRETSRQAHGPGDGDEAAFTFVEYERR